MNATACLFLALLTGALPAALSVSAQTYPYIVDFESANTAPSSKAYASADTVTIDHLDWIMPGVYLGYALASDYKIGDRSCRIRLSNNTSGTPGYMCMVEDLSYGIDSVRFFTAMYGAETGGKLVLEYSTDQGATWTIAGDTIVVPDSSAPLTVTRGLSLSGNVRIAIRKAETSNERINIDQIHITNQDTVITDLAWQSLFPSGPGISPFIRTLFAVFEDSVVIGDGELRLHASNGRVQTFDLTATDTFATTGDTLWMKGVTLLPNLAYHITFDSAAFRNPTGYKVSRGIQDSFSWAFRTTDDHITGLDETFQYCEDSHLGIFSAWNAGGPAFWACDDTEGSATAPCARISSGPRTGDAERDFLISKLPLDLSGMVAPQLHFAEKGEGSDAFIREVLYSTNYRGGDPEDSLVTWQTLMPLNNIAPNGRWHGRQAGLEQLLQQPFFLAFRYSSPAGTTAGEWSLDSVRVREYSSRIGNLKGDKTRLQVLGEATSQEITFSLQLAKRGTVGVALYDLTGRCRYRGKIQHRSGRGIYRIHPGPVAAGIYVLRIQPGKYPEYRTKVSIYR